MNTRLAFAQLAACLLIGCGSTYRPAGGAAPPLAVHLVVDKAAPGTLEFLADGAAKGVAYYFPDKQINGIRVESASFEPTQTTNYVNVQLAAADRDKIKSFATAHPEAKYLGIRFESTPAGPEAGGGISRGAVIFHVFTIRDLTADGRLRFSRSTRQEADALAKRLVGQ